MPISKRAKTARRGRRLRPPVKAASLDTTIQQDRGRWCWAACIQVALKRRGIRRSQADLARSALQLPRARGRPLPKSANVGLADEQITELFRQQGRPDVMLTGRLGAKPLKAALRKGPVAVAFKWGHMCLVYEHQHGKYLVYDPLGPASGALTRTELMNYGQNSNNWDASWTGL